MLKTDLAGRAGLPPHFRPGGPSLVLSSGAGQSLTGFANEARPEWLYFLDDHQLQVVDAIVSALEDGLAGATPSAHLLLGGPGTGKTSVLLQLLMRLSNSVVEGRETWDVRIDFGARLRDFVRASTGWDLSSICRPVTAEDPADILIVDDPHDTSQIERQANLLQIGALGALVVGFDPLQLKDSISDMDYGELRRRVEASEYVLSSCYRQKAEVGQLALRVADAVAASSPFLREDKRLAYKSDRSRLTALANAVEFVNPSGRVVVDEDADESAWSQYLIWISTLDLWRHWPPLLVVVDDLIQLPPSWSAAASNLKHEKVKLSETEKIKGLEYQHVALVLAGSTYAAIRDGFSGSGQSVYNTYRLARIPFSRAKDSVATFVPSVSIRASPRVPLKAAASSRLARR
jgi:hypothetical protein